MQIPRLETDMSDLRTIFLFLCLYISYLALGALLFHAIECPEEIREKTLLTTQKERFLKLIEDVGEKEIGKLHEACTLMYYHIVYNETSGVTGFINQTIQKLKTEENTDRTCEKWSFFNSMFFAFTSITTIGYGTITPKTQLGRGVTPLYIMFGTPLNCIVIRSLAGFLTQKVST